MASTAWSGDHSPTMSEFHAILTDLRGSPLTPSPLTSGGDSLADGTPHGPSSLSSLPLAQSSWLKSIVGPSPPSLRVFSTHEKKLMELNKEKDISYFDIHQVKPIVSVDNDSYKHATVVQVEDSFRGDSLVHILNVFRNLALQVDKAHLMTDGPHHFHVFNVKDSHGSKIGDPWVLYQIQARFADYWMRQDQEAPPSNTCVDLEITAPYHCDILPRATSLLHGMGCSIKSLHFRKFGTNLAAILRVSSTRVLSDSSFFMALDANLRAVVTEVADPDQTLSHWISVRSSYVVPSMERRLFWLAMDEIYYSRAGIDAPLAAECSVTKCKDSGYTVVTIEGCTTTSVQHALVSNLADLGYVVVHGSVTRDIQVYYLRGGDGPDLDEEIANLKKWLDFSFHWCSLEGTKRLKYCRLNSPHFLKETMHRLKQKQLSLTGLTWYGDESTTLASMDVAIEPDSQSSTPPEPEPETSTVRKVFELGSVFLKGIAKVARLYASTLN